MEQSAGRRRFLKSASVLGVAGGAAGALDNLSPQKAALLLSLALTRTSEPEAVQRYFDEY